MVVPVWPTSTVPPLCFSTASVIVDDVTICREAPPPLQEQQQQQVHTMHHHDHHSRSLGGGNTYACHGMAIACTILNIQQAPGMVASVGRDALEEFDFVRQMQSAGIDTTGVTIRDGVPNPCGRLVSYRDGTRHFRITDADTYAAYFRTTAASVPDEYIGAGGVHLLASPERAAAMVHTLRHRGFQGLTLLEPSPRIGPHDLPALQEHGRTFHIFSPNVHEARTLLSAPPIETYEHLTQSLLEVCGFSIVVLRCGADGCVVGLRGEPQHTIHVPAVAAARFVDDTGCGNVFCGALLAALCQPRGEEAALGSGNGDNDDDPDDQGGDGAGNDGGDWRGREEGAAMRGGFPGDLPRQHNDGNGSGVARVAPWVEEVLTNRDRLTFAALQACVAASLCLETEGVPVRVSRDDHAARFAALACRVQPQHS